MDWNSDMAIEEKQRKVGEFIGIRFCDSRTLKLDEDIMAEVRQVAGKKTWRKFIAHNHDGSASMDRSKMACIPILKGNSRSGRV
ncbi:hypothetical protein EDB81DRAFT_818554 [Dactylonectria macrodidyma]|uniref:Uncharacterized protein n=1 Tax=Dactylonectria macrodidyma TaxID=307937 RepID=A0A9P9IF41_9HYPO|nr:hypothetical protein EDB81DRAFT_818554 [Dactylonectria macrodidyma]